MSNNKVTTAALREMPAPSERVFECRDGYAIETARALASRANRIMPGVRFSAVADYDNNRITITKTIKTDNQNDN